MHLLVDAGNTTTSIALFRHNRPVKIIKLRTDKDSIFKNLKKLSMYKVRKSMISSVVPSLNGFLRRSISKIFKCKPLFLNHKLAGIKINYYRPQQLGSDRIANAVGGFMLFKKPLIIVDFGTAINFDCVGKDGEFLGGIIFPGSEISAAALNNYTEKLPMVKNFTRPRYVIGRSTEENIISGLYYGYISLVKGLIKYLKLSMPKDTKVIFTGGGARKYLKHFNKVKYIPHLSLYGLNFLLNKI